MRRIVQLSLQVAFFTFLLTSGYQGFAQDDEFDADIEEGTDKKTSDKGGVGSFGRGLSKFGNFISINGFVTNEFFFFEEKG
ncbi:MAG: hypothetical protein ACJAWV_001636, partial [Flammeovirgaceae bacterium]